MSKNNSPRTKTKNSSEVSPFYLACRNGDVQFVKDYLLKISDNNWNVNQLEESIQSTPLHAACFYGHKEIVQLLLEYGCDRSQVNSYGLTAYEEAENDEIRQLFKRPTDGDGGKRFQDETTEDCFDLVKRPKERTTEQVKPTNEAESKPKKIPTIYSYETEAEKALEVGYATTSISMCQSKFGRFLADTFQRHSPMSLTSIINKLQELIDQEITAINDPQSEKANDLLKKYTKDSNNPSIEHLIRLYTLETKFYRVLRQNPMPLALPLYIKLHTLKNRFFQGQSYRGAKMDDEEIKTYQWGVEHHGALLQTRHFSSTSLNRAVAEEFSTKNKNKKGENSRPNAVLFIFNFPKKSEQAINLNRISDEHPCLSEFEDEAEILILPWTLFQVDNVEKDPSSSSYTITLTNVLLPRKNIFSSLKWIFEHPKGSMKRFREHFPEKQPETVVKELMHALSVEDEVYYF